jgi:Protein of unknown function (DUF3593)/Protein of unknown function (DUF2499)
MKAKRRLSFSVALMLLGATLLLLPFSAALLVPAADIVNNNRHGNPGIIIIPRRSSRTKMRSLPNTKKGRSSRLQALDTAASLLTEQPLPMLSSIVSSSTALIAASNSLLSSVDKDTAEALAGPLFGASLFPYLAFLYFLNVPENECPRGVVVGFATCLLFVFLTIPAAIAAKLLYGVSLADCDWLHGSAESMLTITNLATVLPFRQALNAKEKNSAEMPRSATSYEPMTWLVLGLTMLATATVLVPAFSNPSVHTPYLNGFLDLPFTLESLGAHPEPDNALTVATWIIHVSSLVEFLVAMGFAWRWADVVSNPNWKGLTWGLIPLHSSGITACVSHLFYNKIAMLVPLQALLTCIGNTTAAYATYRIARSNGWTPDEALPEFLRVKLLDLPPIYQETTKSGPPPEMKQDAESLVGFEDLGQALAGDNDYTFLIKLFVGCAFFSYVVKYGETFFDFPYEGNLALGLAFIFVPSALNAYKWNRRSKDPSFEGWF